MNQQLPKEIDNESSYQETLSILSQQSKPSKVLCLLMNMLESYRQSRKMGWSRPWNKYGLKTFQSFKLEPYDDAELIDQAQNSVQQLQDIPPQALDFIHELLANPEQLMGFLFFSEYAEGEQKFETVTFSLGRKVSGNTRFRDRFDIIFDAAVEHHTAQPLTRIRLYVDPYQESSKEMLWSTTLTENIPSGLQQLFEHLCQLSWQWQTRDEKHWDHWTSRYIDYFGPRSFEVAHSHFFQESGQRFQSSVDV